jgi:hypothetical protein
MAGIVAHQAHTTRKSPATTQRMLGLCAIHSAQMPNAANATANIRRSHGHGKFE